MNWLLILVVLIVAGNIVWGFAKGGLRVIYSMIAWIVIVGFVTFATPYVAQWLTDHTTWNTRIEKSCQEKLKDAVKGSDKDKKKKKVQELQMNVPSIVADRLLDTNEAADAVMEKSGAYQALASKASSLAMRAIAFVIVLLITFIAFHLIAGAIDLIGKLPLIGEVNHLLGGVAGLIKGMVLVWLLFAFIAMGAATDIGHTLTEVIYTDQILRWLYENNFLLTILLSFL